MSYAPSAVPAVDDDEKIGPGRIVAAIIFAVFAIAFLVVAGIYFTTPARDLPGFMGYANTQAIHRLYAVGTTLIGLAFAVCAWFALRYRSLALEEAREADRAAQAAARAAASPGPSAGVGLSAGAGPSAGVGPLDEGGTRPVDATHS